MHSKPVSFFSEGVRLSGTLTLPEPKRALGKAVVLAHGYANTREEMGGFTQLAQALADAGYASLRFDCRGCGTSGGVPGSMLPATEWIQDLLSAVSFLRTESEIDHEHIGAVGISMGGSNVVHAAALDERIRCVVSLCPGGDGRRWMEWLWTRNRGQAAWQNFLDCLEQDRAQRTLSGRSVFVSIPTQILAQDDAGVQNWQRIGAEIFRISFRGVVGIGREHFELAPRRSCASHCAATNPIRSWHRRHTCAAERNGRFVRTCA
jgi:pimeloyl-ACP methyl ester carboxylesterase